MKFVGSLILILALGFILAPLAITGSAYADGDDEAEVELEAEVVPPPPPGGGGGGGFSSPTEPTKPPEEPAEPVVPEPEPTPTPPAPPPAPEEPEGPSGLAPGAWAGIGIGAALLVALLVWLILRRWVWAAADGEDS